MWKSKKEKEKETTFSATLKATSPDPFLESTEELILKKNKLQGQAPTILHQTSDD